MIKNWFVAVAAVLYLGATIYEVVQGRFMMATVFFSYTVANVALAVI